MIAPSVSEEGTRSPQLSATALDVHEGITDPEGERACKRWPDDLRLRSTLDELVRGRCKATNLCAYCAKLAAVENSELLWLDALNGTAPTMWLTLTTPSTAMDPATFYADRWQLVKALRRAFPGLEWAALVEFTTGYGLNSGGRRRPHWNLFLKGVGESDREAVLAIVEKVWCPRQRASIDAQHLTIVRDLAGLIRYVALHFQKESQAPPVGWRGHRFLKSRGYLWTDTPTARADARRSLRLKREVCRAEAEGAEGEAALELAHLAVYEAEELGWELVRLVDVPTGWAPDGAPQAWDVEICPVERPRARKRRAERPSKPRRNDHVTDTTPPQRARARAAPGRARGARTDVSPPRGAAPPARRPRPRRAEPDTGSVSIAGP